MRDQEILGLWEAYQQVYSQPQELTEEVEIAAQYFYEMGLNEEGVEILIEELGLEEFTEFVYDIAEDYVLTEARAGGVKIEPKLSSGKAIEGKPKAASLKSLRKKKAARQEAEEKASAEKPSGMRASLQRQSAIANAKKEQPRKKGILDRVAGAVLKGIERHNTAMSTARGNVERMRKDTGVTVGKVKKAAGEFKKGFVGEETEIFDIILEYLVAEGYAETNEAATAIMANMSEEWRQSIVEAEVLAMKGGVPGSVKVKPALSIPGTSIGVGPNKPVPGTFTTTTPGQREKIASGSPTIDRGTYQQSRVGAGPTSTERQRYNAELVRQGKHSASTMPQ